MKTYLISCGQFIKIGRSKDPQKRLQQLQAALPQELSLILVLDGDHELRLHKLFARYRKNGEWFHYSNELRLFILKEQNKVHRPCFYEWLLQQKDRSDQVGQLAHHVARDQTFPQANRINPLLRQFEQTSPIRRAIKKAHREWRHLKPTFDFVSAHHAVFVDDPNEASS